MNGFCSTTTYSQLDSLPTALAMDEIVADAADFVVSMEVADQVPVELKETCMGAQGHAMTFAFTGVRTRRVLVRDFSVSSESTFASFRGLLAFVRTRKVVVEKVGNVAFACRMLVVLTESIPALFNPSFLDVLFESSFRAYTEVSFGDLVVAFAI